MKRFLGFMAISLMAILPFSVKAATSIDHTCGNADADGYVTCTIKYKIGEDSGLDKMTITLTEEGGAEIINVDNATDSKWTVANATAEDGPVGSRAWTILLTSPGVNGEGELFQFKYKKSGTENCKVTYSLGDISTPINPDPDPETPTENKDTGASLPYVALGSIALIAVGAYFATKNRAKMYKI